tara:strand:- start:87 stop:542 length:456 start_codon:yes stop_codon:yes gene_type:complete
MKKYFILFIVSILSSCITYKELEFKEINNFSLSKQSGCNPICIYVDIYNPNNFNIKLQKGNGRLEINEKKVGELHINQKAKLKSNNVSTVQLMISSTSKNVFKTLFSSIEVLFGKKVNLSIIGYIKAKAYGISHKISFNESRQIGIEDLQK